MSLGMNSITHVGLVLLTLFPGVECIDFEDPTTLAITIGCAIGAVILLILIVTCCAYCYIKEDEGHKQTSEFDHHHRYPPHHQPHHIPHQPHGYTRDHNQSSLINGGGIHNEGSLHNSDLQQNNMAVPPGIWTTNPSMYMGSMPPPPGGGGYMTNGSYATNPRQLPAGGTNYVVANGAGFSTLPPPQQSTHVPYNAQYGSMPRPAMNGGVGGGQNYGSNPRPSPRNYMQPNGYPNGYATQQSDAQQQRHKKSWYQKTIGRAHQALKNIPAVFQVRQSNKETLSYKKLLAQQEAARQFQNPELRHKSSQQNGKPGGDVTSRKLPRNGGIPNGHAGQTNPGERTDIRPPRYSQYEEHESVIPGESTHDDSQQKLLPDTPRDQQVPDDDVIDGMGDSREQEQIASAQRRSTRIPEEGSIAKVFSDYREPADVLPVPEAEGIARVFSSYDTGLNSRPVSKGYNRMVSNESEHKYALPQDALPAMIQSDFSLNRNGNRVSRTQSNLDPMRSGPFVASKYSNYSGYIPGQGGSAGPITGSRLPGQRGVVLRSPSELQRLGNYRSASLERYASQYRNYGQQPTQLRTQQQQNIPQRSRTRAEIIRDEKLAKEAAAKQGKKSKHQLKQEMKMQQHSKKSEHSHHHHHHYHGKKHSDANKKKSEYLEPRSVQNTNNMAAQNGGAQNYAGSFSTQNMVTQQSYQTVPGPKSAAPSQPQIFPMSAAAAGDSRQLLNKPTMSTTISQSPQQEDPFAIYARPNKVKQQEGQENKPSRRDLGRVKSIDVPTLNPAPFVEPVSPLSPEPPQLPPHPSLLSPEATATSPVIGTAVPGSTDATPAAGAHPGATLSPDGAVSQATTPKTPRSRSRNKSESASVNYALTGDDVTASAFRFLEDMDTDHDASFRDDTEK